MIASRHSSLFITASMTAHGGSRKYLYLTVCTGHMLAMCVGIAMAWSSPFVPKLLDEKFLDENPLGRVITQEEAAWIGSLLACGGMFGTYLAGFLAEKCGRKKSLVIACALPILTSFLILAHAKEVHLFFAGRFLAGVAVSGVFTVIPMYSGEIAEDSIRGLVCSSISTFETLGELISYTAGPFLSINKFCLMAVGIVVIATGLIVAVIPESPYYLVGINDNQGAEEALIRLRSTVGREIVQELHFIQLVVNEFKDESGSIKDLFKSKALVKALTIAWSLTFFQNCSGIIPILFYSQLIFDESGSELPPEYSAMSIGAIQFVSSFITPNLVDRLGRRQMLFMSSVGMCIAEIHLGLYFFFKDRGEDMSTYFWLPILCLVSYMIFYIVGFGPLVWTILGEIFPNNVKSTAAALTISIWWTLAFVISRSFQPIADVIGMAGCFWLFAGNCALAALFVVTYLIETKGKSLQEIQDLLAK